jgi:hypothetical protein
VVITMVATNRDREKGDATGLSRGFFTVIALSKQPTMAAIVNYHGASPWHTVTWFANSY